MTSAPYVGDLLSLRTADGQQWTLPDGERYALVYGGFGAPPTTFITNTQYRADAAVERGLMYETTELTVLFHQKTTSNRATYWRQRAALIDVLRWNRGGPLVLTLQREDGTRRAIEVYADPGATLPARDPSDDIWLIEESLSFIALRPVWYNPDATTVAGVLDVSGGLTFPITFPITFGGGARYNMPLQGYGGTYDSFPVITVNGPYNSIAFSSNAVAASFKMDVPIQAGEQRIINLNPQNRTILDSAGVNCIGDLADGFDLVHFKIVPAPYDPGSGQTMTALVKGRSNATAVSMTFNEQFIGI